MKILDGQQDLRSLTGLQRAVGRRLAKEETQVEGLMLNQFLKIVQQAKLVSPGHFPSCSTEDLHKICASLGSEKIAFPPKFMLNILMRHVNTLVSEHRFQELVPINSPWHSGAFRWQLPILGALAGDEAKKMGIYRKVLFEGVLCKQILRGEEAGGVLQTLCGQLLDIGNEVDRIMLDAAAAATLSESEAAWHCLTALLSDDVEMAREDLYLSQS